MQVLLDEAPGLLGSIVDVRITSASRWNTFGEVVFWVFRCPEPDDESDSAAVATRARARARVTAGRDRAQSLQLCSASQSPVAPASAGAEAEGTAAPSPTRENTGCGQDDCAWTGVSAASGQAQGGALRGAQAAAVANENRVGANAADQRTALCKDTRGHGVARSQRYAQVWCSWWRYRREGVRGAVDRLDCADRWLAGAAAAGVLGLAAAAVLHTGALQVSTNACS
jgi:hypothetical protein